MRSNTLTKLLIAINIIVFLIQILAGGPSNTQVLVKMGANVSPLIREGQYYRLVTAAFLHLSLPHLAANMYSLYNIGSALEGAIGTFNFALIYFISAITGNLLSHIMAPQAISAGASTSIFGIMGALAYLLIRGNSSAGTGILSSIAINLFYNILNPYVDLWGHVGGLVGGIASMFLILTGRRLR